ncbi:MAG: hypothetical protein ACJAT5_000183 [Lentimonas sp.]|jgi:hypothetical protein
MSGRSNIQSNWHPNFRIESTLPDTRTIRTHFIVKVAIYTFVLIAAAFVLQREYQAYMLRQTISELELQVQKTSSADLSRLKKSERFRKLALNVKELQRVFMAPLMAHESIVELASIKPKELTFTRLVLSERVVQVRSGRKSTPKVIFSLNISGDVQDLLILTQFKRELEESQLLNPSGYKVIINEDIQQRDVDTGIIPFQLSVSLEPAKSESTIK